MLANIFLHHVLDEWFVKDVQPRMQGRCFLIRFADDCIMGCELAADARRVMEVLPERFTRFSLTIHPEKTVLIACKRPPSRDQSAGGKGICDFLVLQRDFTPVNEVVAHVVFDARDTPHNCALGGIARPPKPSRCRIPVWAIPPSTTDGPAARSNRSLFFNRCC